MGREPQIGDTVELVEDRTGRVVAIGIFERNYILDEYPTVIIGGVGYDLTDECSTYYIRLKENE